MTFAHNKKHAQAIADNWGPYFTEAATGGSLDNFKGLFSEDDPVYVVLQNKDGVEAEFSIGDQEDSDMTWKDFMSVAFIDLEVQNYVKTESLSLGLLGNRTILEVGRINTDGECYLTATSLIEFNPEGKIIGFEAFSDLKADEIFAAGKETE
jgi:hypothetical protein